MYRNGKIYPIADIDKGYLYMGPATDLINAGKAWTDKLSNHGINIVVSMLRSDESEYLYVSNEAKVLEKLGLTFKQFPITDLGCPDNEGDFAQFLKQLYQEIKDGKKLYVHCHAGIGRAGLVSCGLLALNGKPLDDIYDYLEQKRGLKSPQTENQRIWFKVFAKQYLLNKKEKTV